MMAKVIKIEEIHSNIVGIDIGFNDIFVSTGDNKKLVFRSL